MILDFLTNWRYYSRGNELVWKEAIDFIKSIDHNAEEKKYDIRGDAMFAFVQGYETYSVEKGTIECHMNYIDVHSVIVGRELLYYSPIASLDLIKDYRPQSDDLEYSFNPQKATGFELYPGQFAIFFPEEGHMTHVQVSKIPEPVTKVVLKISTDLITIVSPLEGFSGRG